MAIKNSGLELKKLVGSNLLVLGTDRTLKELNKGNIVKIFIAANCATDIKDSINQYCKLSKIPCEELKDDDSEIGVICKKPFSISVVGVLKSK